MRKHCARTAVNPGIWRGGITLSACRGADGAAGFTLAGARIVICTPSFRVSSGLRVGVRTQVLTALQGLRSLAVNRCPRIGDKGLLIVQRLSHLTSLNCYGCVKARSLCRCAFQQDMHLAADKQGMLQNSQRITVKLLHCLRGVNRLQQVILRTAGNAHASM